MRADDLPMSRKPPLGSEVELELRDLNPQGRGSSPNEGLNPPQYAPTGTVVAVKTNLAIFIIAQLTVVTFMSSFSTGLITVAIPTMARDLSIPLQTYYWPLSVYGLTAGSLLLPVGAVAGVLGSRPIYLTGVFLLAVFIMASGLAENDIQLIMFRGMQGIAVALTLPTSVGIITNSIVPGRVRNIGFACTGLGMPLGFSAGSVLGGVFVATTSWRLGWYLCAGIIFAFFLVGIWSLPLDHLSESPSAHRKLHDFPLSCNPVREVFENPWYIKSTRDALVPMFIVHKIHYQAWIVLTCSLRSPHGNRLDWSVYRQHRSGHARVRPCGNLVQPAIHSPSLCYRSADHWTATCPRLCTLDAPSS